MRFGNRESRPADARRSTAFEPRRELLEERRLLAIDLVGQAPPNLPNVATINTANTPQGPFGIALGAATPNGGAGYSVSDIGDVNNDGFDDFLIGAPGVTSNSAGIITTPGPSTTTSTVYLVYGSTQVNTTTVSNVDWLTLNTTGQRVGDLGQLGQPTGTQTNPITGTPGFAYAGIKFFTSSELDSGLGASVSMIRGINGTNAILLGAPNGLDETGANPGTGRAYLVYCNAALNTLAGQNATVDLDNPPPGVLVVTFENNTPGAKTGYSVAGVGDVITDGVPDLAIGAPSATVANSGLINSGAVYLLSGASIPATTTVINLQNVGQTTLTTPTPQPGVLYLGTATAGQAGFSLAGAGNVNGALTSNGISIADFLVGAPTTAAGGTAYLIYGSPTLTSLATPNINNLFFISLGALGTATIPGAIFSGLPAGSMTGYSVASAGDFNNDTLGDIMIGSPAPNIPGAAGRVDLFYGASQSVTGSVLNGTININAPPTGVNSVTFTGPSAGSLAGYAMSSLGRMVASTNFPNDEILLGTPGFNNNQGAVYLVPGHMTTLTGTFELADSVQPVAATLITDTNTSSPAFLGASVSGGTVLPGQIRTADGDALSDFIIGAPGYNVNGATVRNPLPGGVFILEGAFIPLNIPSNTQITTQIGVGVAISTTGVFTVNATAPPALQIFVFSNATISPPFNPVADIDPTTVMVNGVAYPNATLVKDPIDENNDGIPDAIITISPRANIGLTAATTLLTITGRTLATAPANANMSWGGSASIIVTGAPFSPTGVSAIGAPAGAKVPLTIVQPQFGPDRYVPTVAELSAYNYKAIPLNVALNQYLPPTGFRQRILQYYFPKKYLHQFGSRKEDSGDRTSTLGRAVFTRGLKPGKTVTYTHKVPVVPIQRQTETINGPKVSEKLLLKRSLT